MLFLFPSIHTKRTANKNSKDKNLALGSITIAEQVETLSLKILRTETWPRLDYNRRAGRNLVAQSSKDKNRARGNAFEAKGLKDEIIFLGRARPPSIWEPQPSEH